jgi:hypothetical protein
MRGTLNGCFTSIPIYIYIYNIVQLFKTFNEGLIFPPQKLALLLTGLITFIANSGANFEYDLKSTIALLSSRELGLKVESPCLIISAQNHGGSFSEMPFNPTVTHKLKLC